MLCRRAKKSPPCGGVAPLPYQGGLRSRGNDSAGFLLSGAGAPLGCGGSPSIPQSAFADSSLCTREVRWPDGHTVFALARCACLGKESMTAQALGLPGAAAQYDSGGTPPGINGISYNFLQTGRKGSGPFPPTDGGPDRYPGGPGCRCPPRGGRWALPDQNKG